MGIYFAPTGSRCARVCVCACTYACAPTRAFVRGVRVSRRVEGAGRRVCTLVRNLLYATSFGGLPLLEGRFTLENKRCKNRLRIVGSGPWAPESSG